MRLGRARIVLMTPDIFQAWFLRDISKSACRDFLARTSLIIIDEAHALESVLGSNFAYLFRRLCAAHSLARSSPQRKPLQVIAASATILKPETHLHDLTGLRFENIGEGDDGSPHHPRSIFHVGAADKIEADTIAQLLCRMIDETSDGSFVTFMDSRQGVERLAVKIDRGDLVKPYRSGYEPEDRIAIENAIRQANLRGVVSTSALELGVDIPHFAIGINIGVPASRKSFRQRLGRVGRQKSGSFGIFAEPFAFKRFGMTLSDYYRASIEPSYLYLHNRFIQYAHARCLVEELEMLGVVGRKVAPSSVSWPEDFESIFEFSHPEGRSVRPKEFDAIAQIGGDSPHTNYPLRNVPEEAFNVVHGRGGNPFRVGRLSLEQAIREAFPGAVYMHMAKGWYVYEWRSTIFERTIRVSPTQSRSGPSPFIRTFVNFGLDSDGLVERRLRLSEGGFLAECHLQITRKVEGFRDQGGRKLYRDLRREKPSMTPKTRYFRTIGVALQIEEPWFREEGIKQQISVAIHQLMIREYSILPQDIGVVSTNIALMRDGQRERISNAIVIFDSVHGSLRLAEPAYLEFSHLLDRLERSGKMSSPGHDLLHPNTVSNLRNWFENLGSEGATEIQLRASDSFIGHEGWYQVYSIGSVVAQRDAQGVYKEVEVSNYEFLDIDGERRLFYQYKTDTTGIARVSAEKIESLGDEWEMVWWNPETGETKESMDDDED